MFNQYLKTNVIITNNGTAIICIGLHLKVYLVFHQTEATTLNIATVVI